VLLESIGVCTLKNIKTPYRFSACKVLHAARIARCCKQHASQGVASSTHRKVLQAARGWASANSFV